MSFLQDLGQISNEDIWELVSSPFFALDEKLGLVPNDTEVPFTLPAAITLFAFAALVYFGLRESQPYSSDANRINITETLEGGQTASRIEVKALTF